MALKPQKFTSMGIKIRTYQAFKKLPVAAPHQGYQQCRYKLKLAHYSQFNNLTHTLYKLFDRLTAEACIALDFSLKRQTADFVLQRQLTFLKETSNKLIKKVRQLLLSDIMGGLAASFKNKNESIKYFKLHNYIYQALLT